MDYAKLRRLAISALAIAITGMLIVAVVRRRNPPDDPCAGLWALPAHDVNGNPNVQSITEIFNCYEATGMINQMCPPRESAWRQYLAPDSGCP